MSDPLTDEIRRRVQAGRELETRFGEALIAWHVKLARLIFEFLKEHQAKGDPK